VQAQPAAQPTERPRAGDTNNESNVAVRRDPMVGVDRPERVPDNISATPNPNPPIPPGFWRRGDVDTNTGTPDAPGSSTKGGRQMMPPKQVEIGEPPPPPVDPPKTPKVVHKGVITSQAISLPRPNYPPIAKNMGIQGTVSVQVLIDESGRVISAKAVGGSPFLTAEAQKAALQARFSPTVLNDQPVKVSGVITYNFVLNR
jgi:TonB family protein